MLRALICQCHLFREELQQVRLGLVSSSQATLKWLTSTLSSLEQQYWAATCNAAFWLGSVSLKHKPCRLMQCELTWSCIFLQLHVLHLNFWQSLWPSRIILMDHWNLHLSCMHMHNFADSDSSDYNSFHSATCAEMWGCPKDKFKPIRSGLSSVLHRPFEQKNIPGEKSSGSFMCCLSFSRSDDTD